MFSGDIYEIERFLTKKSQKTTPILVETAQENKTKRYLKRNTTYKKYLYMDINGEITISRL